MLRRITLPLEPRSTITPRFILGVFIVLMGVVLILDQLGVMEAHHVARFWPAVLIVLGLSILQRGRSRGAVSGVLLILVGAWLLLNTLGFVSLDLWDYFWPLLLVVIGARIMFRSRHDAGGTPLPFSATAPHDPAENTASAANAGGRTIDGYTTSAADKASVFSLLSGCKRRWSGTTFRSAEVTSILGGCELDLREALLCADGSAHIEVFVLMGGVNIFVPANWSVVLNAMPIMGGIEDNTRNSPSAGGAAAPYGKQQLIVHGTIIMGGIEISN